MHRHVRCGLQLASEQQTSSQSKISNPLSYPSIIASYHATNFEGHKDMRTTPVFVLSAVGDHALLAVHLISPVRWLVNQYGHLHSRRLLRACKLTHIVSRFLHDMIIMLFKTLRCNEIAVWRELADCVGPGRRRHGLAKVSHSLPRSIRVK